MGMATRTCWAESGIPAAGDSRDRGPLV